MTKTVIPRFLRRYVIDGLRKAVFLLMFDGLVQMMQLFFQTMNTLNLFVPVVLFISTPTVDGSKVMRRVFDVYVSPEGLKVQGRKFNLETLNYYLQKFADNSCQFIIMFSAVLQCC